MTDEEVVFVVDDDAVVRDSLRALLESAGHAVEDYGTAGEFLSRLPPSPAGCLVVDVRMPDMDGLALQEELVRRRIGIPVIVMTGYGDVPLAVRAMRAGALDFIEKPFDGEQILADVRNALAMSRKLQSRISAAHAAGAHIALLTPREREVLEQLVAGRSNKVIAHALGISPRTVEIHRAHLMEKMQARTLSDLVRLALAAGVGTQDET